MKRKSAVGSIVLLVVVAACLVGCGSGNGANTSATQSGSGGQSNSTASGNGSQSAATGPGSASGNASSNPPAGSPQPQPATQIEVPQLLVWNFSSDQNAAELYAYRIDSAGTLNVLPGFPLQTPWGAVAVDAASGLLFISHPQSWTNPGPVNFTLDSYLLTASGPQLTASSPPRTFTPASGLPVSGPPSVLGLWTPAHELIATYYGGDGPGYLQRFSYDSSGSMTTTGQLLDAPSSMNYVKALLSRNMLFGWGASYNGHTCDDANMFEVWPVAGDGSLNSPTASYAGDSCGFVPTAVAISNSGQFVVVGDGSGGNAFPTLPTQLQTQRLNSDGSLQQISSVSLSPSAQGGIDRIAVDDAHGLVFAAITLPNTPPLLPELVWYGFDPVTGALSQQPLGTLSNVGDATMVGNYLVTLAPSTLSVYSITSAGPVLLSQQSLPLTNTILVPVN